MHLPGTLVFKAAGTIGQKLCLPRWTRWISWMWHGRRDTPKQIKEHAGGVFVGRNRNPKHHISQMLQRVRESVISKLTGLPQTIALAAILRREVGQSVGLVGAA